MNVACNILNLPEILNFFLLGHWLGEGPRLLVAVTVPKPVVDPASQCLWQRHVVIERCLFDDKNATCQVSGKALREQTSLVLAPPRSDIGRRQDRDKIRRAMKFGRDFLVEGVVPAKIMRVEPDREPLGTPNLLC